IFFRLGRATGFGLALEVEVQKVDVLRYGDFNAEFHYWPVEMCVTVKAWDRNREMMVRQSGGQSNVKTIGAKVRARLFRDDFGDWRATILEPDPGESVQQFICTASQPSNETLGQWIIEVDLENETVRKQHLMLMENSLELVVADYSGTKRT